MCSAEVPGCCIQHDAVRWCEGAVAAGIALILIKHFADEHFPVRMDWQGSPSLSSVNLPALKHSAELFCCISRT